MAPKSTSATSDSAPSPRAAQPPTTQSHTAQHAAAAPEPDGLNVAIVAGAVSSEPVHKELPSGSVLIGFSVSVRTAADPAATSLPVVWFDPPSNAASIERGLDVVVVGRLARRFFRAGGQTQSRTELVAQRVEPARRRATCRRLLGGASDDIETFAETWLS